MGWIIKEVDGKRVPTWVEDEPVEVLPEQPKESSYKEFHKIDMTTGERIDVLLFDVNNDVIPEDCKLGWFEGFHNPVWDFELDTWVEGADIADIIEPLKQGKIDQLNEQCQSAIHAGFEYEGMFFQFTEQDQSNFNQQLSLILLDETVDNIVWKTENLGVQILSREVFIEACKAGETHKRNNIGHYWQLKEYVLNHKFSSVEELDSIDFTFIIGTNTDTEVGV